VLGWLVATDQTLQRPDRAIAVFAVQPAAQDEVRRALEAEKGHPLPGTRVVLVDVPEGKAALASPLWR
jgi:hypothetical protein